MLSVKLVRSLVLGETMSNPHDHLQYDADHDDDHDHHGGGRVKNKLKHKMKKMPMLLFIPTRELISDTFRLATIARDLGMDFQPNTSLSHLLFSWPPSSSSSYHHHHTSPSQSSSSSTATNHRTSVSSQTSTFTSTSSSTTTTTLSTVFQNDAVPIPFPSLSTTSSLSLLRSFISLTKGLFKLVFLDISPNSDPNSNPNFVNYYHSLLNYDTPVHFSLFSRVSGKRVKSIDELSTELAGKGWSLYRSPKKKVGSLTPLVLDNPVYLFRKTDSNRVRVKNMGNMSGGGGGGGECRVRELRLPALDFEKGVNLRVLLYILLMTDDVFYLA